MYKIYITRMIPRPLFLQRIAEALEVTPICALIGPRQCGKTTLARLYGASSSDPVHLFDLENPTDLARLENAILALAPLEGLIVIDEIQRRPELFAALRVIVDRYQKKLLILGSASPELLRQSSESLAGRISYVELTPLLLDETRDVKKLWLRGGFPKSYLAATDAISSRWRATYVRTFLEQDVPNLGFKIAPQTLRRFWMMLAHYHGQTLNGSELGRSIDVSQHTVNRYLDVLAGTFMIRRLGPWFANVGKRQVKSPKIYFRDSGLFHSLLGITTGADLATHPKLGASWEGMAMEEVIQRSQADANDCYFWATQAGAELDLLIVKDGRKLGYEIKHTDSPNLTKSMVVALQDLELDELTVIIPGNQAFQLAAKVYVRGLG